jgi:MFS family permease
MNRLAHLRRAILLVSLPFGILSFTLPIYGKAIGADAVQIGLFFSAFSLMTVLLRPLVGAGLDRIGRRPFLLAGLVGYGITMFVFAYATQVWIITLGRVCQGISSAFLWLAARAITADLASSDQRGRSFGSVDQASSQGAILGTFIGYGVLLTLTFDNGWRPLFIGYGVLGLVAAFTATRSLPETRSAMAGAQRDRRPLPRSRPWVLLLLVTAVTGASWAMISPILMVFLQEKLAVGVDALAWAYLPAALIWALLPSRLGRLADQLGRKPLMVVGLVAAAGSSFLIPHLASLAALTFLWAFQALCYAAGDPAEAALVTDLTGGDQRGRAFGIYTLAAGLGATVGPLLGGWLYENTGVSSPFYANGAVLALCAIVLMALLQEPGSAPTEGSGPPGVRVGASKIHGTGVFATTPFAKGECILDIDDSRRVTPENPLQTSLGEYEHHCDYLAGGVVVLMQWPERHINHSCNPNTFVKTSAGTRQVIALRNIAPGEEITYHYAINGFGDTFWQCGCQSKECLGTVPSNFFQLPLPLQIGYLSLLDSWYLEEYRYQVTELRRQVEIHKEREQTDG